MPRSVPPERWAKYMQHRRVHSFANAARLSGISEPTSRLFEKELRLEARGFPSERRSSGWNYFSWAAEQAALADAELEAASA